ncbi:hypothetical protein FSP39_019742 [Pinctada imbricata]|uniref:Uncharacterized protein n=1 Tax=Pinctada imbricata TaxID=66713 RepID=A0AA88YEI1_PINIB|nr:hypothetical protein FSP39_019742 [Pinctada imbricata]
MTSRKRSFDDHDSDNVDANSSKKMSRCSLRQCLDEYGVTYAGIPKPISNIFDSLKDGHRPVNVPSCMKLFEKFTKNAVPFSLEDVNWSNDLQFTLESDRMAVDTVEDAQKKLLKLADDMETDDFLKDKLQKRLFMTWFEKVFSFLGEIKEILEKLNVPSQSSTKQGPNLREGVFTHLFLKFAEIFFLKPEVGDNPEIELKKQNEIVGCIPDVRFYEHTHKGTQANLLLMLAEVKRDALTEPSDGVVVCNQTRIGRMIDRQILDQIGMELVEESGVSSFAPQTVGIIVMRTEIIFLILEMGRDHWTAIHKGENVGEKCALIQYTESFDIMKAADRNKLGKFLFWLGCLQKNNLQKYYLLQ